MADQPAFPESVQNTIRFLRRTYASYYRANPLDPVDRMSRREYGFILWPSRPGPPPFIRHRSFPTQKELSAYLASEGPNSAYYSTAFYREPGEQLMVDKSWLGAELIFDLDADHLREVESAKDAGSALSLEKQLHIVKQQFRRLIDDFLMGDFGIPESQMRINFSGGRGYHCHVVDGNYMSLDAKGRREIVDYVTGKIPALKGSEEEDLSHFVWEESVAGLNEKGFSRGVRVLRTHPATAPGWQGRLTRNLGSVLREQILDVEESDAIKFLTGMKGIGTKGASDFVSKCDERMIARIMDGHLDQGGVSRVLLQHVMRNQALPLGRGETDEPVTADVKRLIRLPGSLHGKTGFKALPLTLDTLDDFDPFQDAIAFDDTPIRIIPRLDLELKLAGNSVSVTGGEEVEVPLSHAIFWLSRQQGTYVSTVNR